MMSSVLLNFVCVGAQKSGTTTLHDLLSQCNKVSLPSVKETKFFHDGDKLQYTNGLEWYFREYFRHADTEKNVLGEVDPEYLYFQEVPKRIHDHNKNAKIIIILRNPAKRAFSQYIMTKSRGYEDAPFEKALALESMRLRTGGVFAKTHYSYYSRGEYYQQVKRYYDLFGPKNVFVINFEEFLDFKNSMPKIFRFIDVDCNDSYRMNLDVHSNKGMKPKSQMLSRVIHLSGGLRGRVLSALIGDQLKFRLKKLLINLNTSNQQYKDKMEHSLYEMLMKKYRDDVELLTELTGINFIRIWYG